jgi:hydrogenase maturation protease
MEKDIKAITIGGVGNILAGDDAVGPYVVRTLDALYEFPGHVRVEDLGTPGLDLVTHLSGIDALILIDSANNDAPPGSIVLYRRDDLTRFGAPLRLDPHSPLLTESLLIAEMAGGGPRELLLVGVTGKQFETHGLSDVVLQSVPLAIDAVLAELDRLGIIYEKRTTAIAPDIFWERNT